MSALRSFHHIFKYSLGPDSVLLNWQIISEFEKILGLETSVLDTFINNFAQVTDSILTMARRTKKKAEELTGFLGLLETDESDVDEEAPTPGTLQYYHIIPNNSFCSYYQIQCNSFGE